jgi:uncharacterized membrane protein
MKGLIDTFKSIAIGGVLFLIPITITVVVVAKVVGFLSIVAEPMADFLPTDTILGFGLAQVIALALLLAVCLVAGLIARSTLAQGLLKRLESGLLAAVPGYGIIKGLADQVLRSQEQAERFKPVLVPARGGLRPAFEIERMPSGQVAVLLPGAPNPWSGYVAYLDSEQVQPLDMKATDLMHTLEGLGIGSGKHETSYRTGS